MSDETIAVWTRMFDVLERGNAERYEAAEQPTPASTKDNILYHLLKKIVCIN